MVGIDGHVPFIMEHIIEFQMGIGKVYVFIGIIDVPIGKTYGFDPNQYGGTTIKNCCYSILVIVLKRFSTLGFTIDKSVEFITINVQKFCNCGWFSEFDVTQLHKSSII